MANVLSELFQDIADSIRGKTGSAETLTPIEFPSAIEGITGGGVEGCATVTFMNGEIPLLTRPVYIGDDCPDPVAQGRIGVPTKESTAQYDYTHNGWSTDDDGVADSTVLQNITEDKTLYAVYSSTVRKYTVTFFDDDGVTVLSTQQVAYGSYPSYTPTKNGVVFQEWNPALSPVLGDTSYTAVWSNALAGGACGETAYWLISTDYVLSIYGEGEVTSCPWKNSALGIAGDVQAVEIAEGITCMNASMALAAMNYKTLTLPKSLKRIVGDCFWMSQYITDVYLPSLKDWLSVELSNASSNPLYSSHNANVYFDGSQFKGDLHIDSVSGIGSYLFYGWSGITDVWITNVYKSKVYGTPVDESYFESYAHIGAGAFGWCKNLTTVEFVGSNVHIDASAFSECSKLSTFYVSSTSDVASIGGLAFKACESLTTIKICKYAYFIGANAFINSGLTSAEFVDASGWTAGTTEIPMNDLQNSSIAATYLTTTYVDQEWTNKVTLSGVL